MDIEAAKRDLTLTETMDGLRIEGNNRKVTALLSLHGHLSDALAALASQQAGEAVAWVSCDDRLPTDDDADIKRCVWGYNPKRGKAVLVEPYYIQGLRADFTHWAPTGLERPEPPQQ